MAIPSEVHRLLAQRDGSTRVALVGANNDPSKYGSIIFLDLARKGFTVLPIHPREPTVHGAAAYPTVADAPGPIHIVNFVVPPAVARQVVDALDPARCDVLWFQPGAYDPAVVRAARDRFPTVIVGDCIMVET